MSFGMTDCHPESRACMRYIFNTHGVSGAFANSDFDAARSIGKIDSPGPKESKHKTNRTGFHLRSEQKCACTNTSTIQSRKRQQPTRCCCANDSAVHRSSTSIRYTGLGRWCQKHCTPKLRLVPPWTERIDSQGYNSTVRVILLIRNVDNQNDTITAFDVIIKPDKKKLFLDRAVVEDCARPKL